ncbi:MAG: hypothetical protein K8L97_26335 [Anaerolineae bacterium]|nr:hypothetical protein [Anaerolineae bacterium]
MNNSHPEYQPPPDQYVERYARAICEQYAVRQNNPKINSPEVVNGLAGFLKVLLRLEAKRLNQSTA